MVKISVVMPVYNTAVPFLKDAVDSILNQTCQDFEFLIIDDGSTGECAEYLAHLRDPRIRIIRNPKNIGITKSLNIGFREAKGKYIARMDSDDISFPARFERQYAFMEAHPDTIVCGTKTAKSLQSPPLNYQEDLESIEQYRVRMLFENPGPSHPTAFFRREKLIQHHLFYDEALTYAQDYGMWMNAIQYGEIYTLPETLLYHRHHSGQISIEHRKQQIKCDQMTIKKLLLQLLDHVTDEEVDLHSFHSSNKNQTATITPQVARWYHRLMKANKKKKIYVQEILAAYICQIKRRLVRKTYGMDTNIIKRVFAYIRYLSFDDILKKIKRNKKNK